MADDAGKADQAAGHLGPSASTVAALTQQQRSENVGAVRQRACVVGLRIDEAGR